METTLLSIAIPTYNRHFELKECLDSIYEDIQKTVDDGIIGYHEIEIYITDNCSTDDTRKLVEKYIDEKKMLRLRYDRNSKNLGMDKNFLKCIENSDGMYIHMMSDDDIMMPGTVKAIVECIRNNEPDFIHLNSGELCYNPDGTPSITKARLELNNDEILHDKNEFLERVGIFITYISTIVYKKQHIQKVLNKEKYVGTYFLQAHIELLSLKDANKIALLKHSCIAERSGNTGGYNLYKVWIEEYKKLLLDTAVEAGFSYQICKKVFLQSCHKSIKNFILNFRMNNTGFDLKNRKCLIYNTYKYPSVWAPLYLSAFVPVWMLKILAKIIRKIRRIFS